jgi:hypothetical protein
LRLVPPRHLLLAAGLILPGRVLAQAPVNRPEYEVKSVYLLNFLLYTTWPASVLGDGDPLVVCVFGDDPFGDFLSRAIEGRRAQGHPIRLAQVDRVVEADRCHAGFIAERNRIPAPVWLERLEGRPVLTVGEGDEFMRAGGMISLVRDEQIVRFDANPRTLRAAGLDLSSRVLRLARTVVGD